jgi:hypothetical protein
MVRKAFKVQMGPLVLQELKGRLVQLVLKEYKEL